MNDIKVLAYYLPQFHPTPENDMYWGKGFTEWTNVAKARPLFKGHFQPHIPADLGFYDLRMPEARELQAEYAKRAGISAFCYWHYWFGNGVRAINLPFDEVVRTGKPDFPFCLAWANHTWYQKSWDGKKGSFSLPKSKVMFEQTYPGIEDYKLHFQTMLPAFKDERYFKIDGRLAFVIYAPLDIPNINVFIDCWQNLALANNLPPFFFIGHCYLRDLLPKVRKLKLDAINYSMHHDILPMERVNSFYLRQLLSKINRHMHLKPTVMEYKKVIERMDTELWNEELIFPTLIPNWDHTPRSGNFGTVFKNSTPELFGKHVEMTLNHLQHKQPEHQIVFLKSWNEWGEGNYMEPDLEFGNARIETLKNVLKNFGR